VPNRFEMTLESHLVQLFTENLTRVLEEGGFHQTLHLAEPHVWEFQDDSHVVTLQTSHSGSHDRAVSLESESMDVNPLVETATRKTVLDLSARLLGALPWIDGKAAAQRLGMVLSEVMR